MEMEGSARPTENQPDLDGSFLISLGRTGEAGVFDHALVLLCSHSKDGAMGLIVNNRFKAPTLADLFSEFNIKSTIDLSNVAVYCGGPVESGRGFILHTADYRCEGTVEVAGNICLTVAQTILGDMAIGRGPKRFLAAMGYAGWDAEQLETELANNMWLGAPATADILFAPRDADKWGMALESIGLTPSLLATGSGNA